MSTGVYRPSTTFRDLALALSEEERRTLLKRIRSSLDVRRAAEEEPFASVVNEGSRAEVIARELRQMGFWQRLRFLLRRLLSTHNDETTYVEFRLAGLRRRAKSVCPDLAPIEHHSVGSAIPARTWELYRAAYPVIPLFLDFWKGGTYLEESVEYLLSQRVPQARSELYDLVSLEGLQEVFMKSELKSDVRSFVVDELDRYLGDIPDELFGHLEEGLLPFYYLRQICLFDYNELFGVFGFDPGIAPPEETPPFRDAPTSAALPVVERLYYGLHSAGKLDDGFYFHTEILDRYLEMKEREERGSEGQNEQGQEGEGTDGEEERSEQAYQRRRLRLQEMRDQIHALHKAARSLARRVPFADLIRYYTRDPWLRIKAYLPELRLREFYRSYLMIRILSQLDEQFPSIRRGVVDRMSDELFDGTPPPMTYFRPGVQITPETPGTPGFTHMRSLTTTFNFLRFVYRGRMQEMVRTLSRILPVRQRDSSSDLIAHVSGIEEALADIEDFDESFSPDSQDGKSYYRVRYQVEKDLTMQRSFRNVVSQRDREAVAIVDKATEHIVGLGSVFDTIARGLTDQIRERYAAADHRVNSLDGLDQLLEAQREKTRRFESLIRQIRAMEEGY
jgi:hypothetical protein